MAKKEPTMGIHQAAVEGRIKPTKRPVTAALPSPKIPWGVRGALVKRASVRMALNVLKTSKSKARHPKNTTPATTAGIRAINTSPMIRSIVKGLRRKGPVFICIYLTPS
jgi:hypothetical protein